MKAINIQDENLQSMMSTRQKSTKSVHRQKSTEGKWIKAHIDQGPHGRIDAMTKAHIDKISH